MTGVRVRQSERRAGRVLLRALLASVVVMILGPPAGALAAAPSITSPENRSATSDSTPTFRGTAEAEGVEVTLRVYSGTAVKGKAVETASVTAGSGGSWEVTPEKRLSNGTYTAEATQAGNSEAEASAPQQDLRDDGNGQRDHEAHVQIGAGKQLRQADAFIEQGRLREAVPGFTHGAVQRRADHQNADEV